MTTVDSPPVPPAPAQASSFGCLLAGIALGGAIRGETGREVNPVEYQLPLIHRQRVREVP